MTNTKKIFVEQNSRTKLTDYAAEVSRSKLGTQYLAAILATLGAFSAGTCLSWTSPALPLFQAGYSDLRLTSEEGSWVGSLITLGAFAGAIPAGAFANLLGRKRLIQILAVPIFASWMLIAYSKYVWCLYIARFLAGTAVGAFSVAIPMYVAELAESRIRGTLGTLFQLQITAGILFEYLLGMMDDLYLIALIPAAIPVIFFCTFSFMPESPFYLASRNKITQAKESLQWFRGPNYDVEDDITKMIDHIAEDKKNEAHIVDLIRSRAASKGLVISLGLMVFQQLSGINAVIFYAEKIFEKTESGMPAYVAPIIVGTVMVIMTYVSTILIDKAGRRILLIISSLVMSLCLGVLAVYFHLLETQNMALHFTIPIISITLYITVFSLGFGPIPWIMIGELFPSKIKGLASSISAALNWVLAFTVTKLFQNLLDLLGSGFTFGTFMVATILATIFVCCMVPETKGKDMKEIQYILAGNVDVEDDSSSSENADEDLEDEIVIHITKENV